MGAPKGKPNPRYTATMAITAIQGSGGFVSVIAMRLGCTPQTVYNLRDRHPTVAEALATEKLRQVDFAEGQLQKRIKDGSDTAIIFYLKTQAKDRGYVERQEVTGAGGGPVQLEHFDADAVREDLLGKLDRIRSGRTTHAERN